jgi:DnaK suppressor protein
MDQAVLKESLLNKRAEILSEGGAKPLQTWISKDARHGDFADKASGYSEAHIQLKIKQTDAKILYAIEDALWRMEQGTYGLCRDCGEAIASVRLNAIPWTRVCITCKEKQRR